MHSRGRFKFLRVLDHGAVRTEHGERDIIGHCPLDRLHVTDSFSDCHQGVTVQDRDALRESAQPWVAAHFLRGLAKGVARTEVGHHARRAVVEAAADAVRPVLHVTHFAFGLGRAS